MVRVIPPYQVSSYVLSKKIEPGIGNKKQRFQGFLKRIYRDSRVEEAEEVLSRPDQLPVPVVGGTSDSKSREERGDQPTLIAESEVKNTAPSKGVAEEQSGAGAPPIVKVETISGDKLQKLKRGATSPSAASARAKERRLREREELFSVAD